MKRRYDLEIADSKQISGGYLMTTEPMTEKQVIAHTEKIGRELLTNNRDITGVGYWLNEEGKDFEEMLHISLFKVGRKICVSATKNGNSVYQNY